MVLRPSRSRKCKLALLIGAVSISIVYAMSINSDGKIAPFMREYTFTKQEKKMKIPEKTRFSSYTKGPLVNDMHSVPIIYVITPTKARTEQIADLTRFSYTLKLVPALHWILVEDAATKSERVAEVLRKSRLMYTHLAAQNPSLDVLRAQQPKVPKSPGWKIPQASYQRNLGIEWVIKNGTMESVVYFADDDNTYDIQIFEEMRYTKKASIWPVAFVGTGFYEVPVVKDGKVVDFAVAWGAERKFPTDMAGFAANTELVFKTHTRFRYDTSLGYDETGFLEQLGISVGELEPRADNCTKILVWHTKTQRTTGNHAQFGKIKEKLSKYNISIDLPL